jgi:hypothetical protein
MTIEGQESTSRWSLGNATIFTIALPRLTNTEHSSSNIPYKSLLGMLVLLLLLLDK